jgi:hypothetical protein
MGSGDGGARLCREEGALQRHAVGRGLASIGLLVLHVILGVGLLRPAMSFGQQPDGSAAVKGSAPEPPRDLVEPLGVKYRFTETYSQAENPAKPYLITQYQVGVHELSKTEKEKPQGAPERSEGSLRVIYTERPVQVTKLGEATDVVRRYDRFQAAGPLMPAPSNPPLLEGLSIWFHLHVGAFPEIFTLTEGRTLRQAEHRIVLNEIFFPSLTLILPSRPTRVGDKWDITRQAGRVLLGNHVPEDGAFRLEGTLLEVRKAAEGTARTAEFEISGELDLDEGNGAVKARVEFLFEPPQATPTPAKAVQGIVDAHGRITKIRMGRVQWFPIDETGRLRQINSSDVILERRPVKPPTVELPPLAKPPVANETNSWVVYDDPKGRFHFRYPQDMMPRPGNPQFNRNGIDLVSLDAAHGNDIIRIVLPPMVEEPGGNQEFRDPGVMVRNSTGFLKEKGWPYFIGHSGWLPEADWAPLGRKVFDHEVAADLTDSEGGKLRVYADYFLVHFERNLRVRIDVLTRRDDHAAFRKTALDLIRSFKTGPSPGAKATSTSSVATPPGQGQPSAAGAAPRSPAEPASPAGTNPSQVGRPTPPLPPSQPQ